MHKPHYLPFLFALFVFFFSLQVFAQSELIISQYIETTVGSIPKGIEIYNVSGSDIVFSASNNLTVSQGQNGNPCESLGINITSGTLEADKVWVIGDIDLINYATANGADLSGTENYNFSFNGNDPLQIELGGVVQDMFALCGDLPALGYWAGSGISTHDENLRIIDGVCHGDPDGWLDPSERFQYEADGLTMTHFGDAPQSCSNTRVQFVSSSTSLSESTATIDICVEILNPDPLSATSAQIALSGTDNPHISPYSTATVTFPAGNSAQKCITLSIADDPICANGETYNFTLQNIAGPVDATVGSKNSFELIVLDDDGVIQTIAKQGFEENASETLTYTNTNGIISTANGGTPSNERIKTGSKSFQVNAPTSDLFISILDFNVQDISAYIDVELEIWNSSISVNSSNGADADDYIEVFVSETPFFGSTPNIELTGAASARYGMNGTYVVYVDAPSNINYQTSAGGDLVPSLSPSKLLVSIPDSWNTVYTQIRLRNNSINEVWCLDDIKLSGIICAACVNPTIASFTPTSGPAETEVNVVGTNFITGGAISDVQFGNISASSFNVISDTELTAVVPANANTGLLKIIRLGCVAFSSNNFTFLEEDCDIRAASLIISELCDPNNNASTDRFIEIYNPSDVTIDLTDWQLYSLSNQSQIYSPASANPGHFWTLSGTINPGEALTCGNTSTISGGTHDFPHPNWNSSTIGVGSYNWNGSSNDGAALFYNGELVDAVLIDPSDNYAVFKDKSLIRNSDVCDPNPNSPITEWTATAGVGNANQAPATLGSHSSCTLLTGANPSVVNATTPNLAEPVCNQPDIVVTASSSSAISYQWFYNDGSATWTEISDGAVFSGATTASLTILNLIGMDNYQFYCRLITDLACENYTNAIPVSILPNDKIYFLSQGSGLWDDPATWSFSSDLTTYSSSCIYPTINSSEIVEINAGTTVTYNLTDTDTIPAVNIRTGGTLETEPTHNLILENVSSGAELFINGTFIDNGTSSGSIEFLNGATWQLMAGGTIVKTNTSSTTRYRDNYQSGIANINADGNWIYRRVGNNDVSIVSVNMFYPNLAFENNFGTSNYSSTSNFHNFSGSSSTVTIKGDLAIGMSGSGTYTLRNLNANANPIFVAKDLQIGAGSSFINTNGSNIGRGIAVQGHMDIEGTLDFTSGTGATQGVLTLSGAQDMIGIGGATVLVNNLEIAKNTGFDILADLTFDVRREIKFTNGILELNSISNEVILPSAIIVSGTPGNASHIDGFIRKSGIEAFTFPVGDAGYYQPIKIKDLNQISVFKARYVAEPHPDAGPHYDGNAEGAGFLEELGHCDYWTLNRLAGDSANIALTYGENPCNVITNTNYLNIAKWDGLNWEYPIIGVDPTTVPLEISSTTPFGTFSDFVLASTGGQNFNVLPIELHEFTATPYSGIVLTAWQTLSEYNNAYFTVERSADARLFQELGNVQGAGTSHSKKVYDFTDKQPLSGTSYYRLKQTDFDGTSTYSAIKSVTFSNTSPFELEQAYRSENALNLVFQSTSPYILVEIFDVLGKRVFTEIAENYGGRSVLLPSINRGAYIVHISSGSKSDSGKIVW